MLLVFWYVETISMHWTFWHMSRTRSLFVARWINWKSIPLCKPGPIVAMRKGKRSVTGVGSCARNCRPILAIVSLQTLQNNHQWRHHSIAPVILCISLQYHPLLLRQPFAPHNMHPNYLFCAGVGPTHFWYWMNGAKTKIGTLQYHFFVSIVIFDREGAILG
jgi:hypothetical protein